MQVKLTEGEWARLHYTTTNNVEAWTHWVQGLLCYRQAVTKEHIGRALSRQAKFCRKIRKIYIALTGYRGREVP